MDSSMDIFGWGIDRSDDNRPGVPMERRPRHLDASRQIATRSSVVPPRGLSGLLRRAVYKIPEHKPIRPMLLMLADRIDVLEHGMGRPLLWLGGVGLLGALAQVARLTVRRRRRTWKR